MLFNKQKSLIVRLALIMTLSGGMFTSTLIQSVFAEAPPFRDSRDFAIYEDNATISPGETVRVSVYSTGAQGDNASYLPSISADGRYVAFISAAANLVNSDTNGAEDIFVYDLQTGIPIRVSVDSSGAQANGGRGKPGSVVPFLQA